MALLASGIVIWIAAHLSIRLTPNLKRMAVDRLGLWVYRLLFAAVVITAIACIVYGWQSAQPEQLYFLPWARPLTLGLMVVACCLLMAFPMRSDIKQYLRHPQLLGFVVWAIAHLLANGDSRSLLLFGGLGLWALIEMPVINATSEAWQKPAPVGAVKTTLSLICGIVLYAALLNLHLWFTGIPLI